MPTVYERVGGTRVSLGLLLILACSSVALCGEIHDAVKNNDRYVENGVIDLSDPSGQGFLHSTA